MTLDTPHGFIKEFLLKMPEKCGKNEGKMRGKLFFSPFGVWFDSKTRSHSGLHAKKNREKSLKTLCMEMWTFPLGG